MLKNEYSIFMVCTFYSMFWNFLDILLKTSRAWNITRQFIFSLQVILYTYTITHTYCKTLILIHLCCFLSKKLDLHYLFKSLVWSCKFIWSLYLKNDWNVVPTIWIKHNCFFLFFYQQQIGRFALGLWYPPATSGGAFVAYQWFFSFNVGGMD